MKISGIAILALRGTSTDFKQKLAGVLGVSLSSVYRYLETNDDNLTKAAAMQLIRQETGLTDQQLLEPY